MKPRGAYVDTTLGEFILPYEAVRSVEPLDDALLDFMQRSYKAEGIIAGV